jgi:hypothetical protein
MFVQCVPFKVVVLELCDMKSDEEMAMLMYLTLSLLFQICSFIFMGLIIYHIRWLIFDIKGTDFWVVSLRNISPNSRKDKSSLI